MKFYSIGINRADILMGALFLLVVTGLVCKGLHTLPRNYTAIEGRNAFN